MIDEFEEPSEVVDLRLRSDSHELGAKRHRAVIESLYKEYIDSMGKLTRERIRPYRDWETDRKSTRLNSSHRL